MIRIYYIESSYYHTKQRNLSIVKHLSHSIKICNHQINTYLDDYIHDGLSSQERFMYELITDSFLIIQIYQLFSFDDMYMRLLFKSMSNLQEISETLRNQLNEVQRKIEGLKKSSGDERFDNANKYQKQLNRIKNLIQTYDFTIRDSLEDGLGSHESQYKEFQKKHQQLQKLLEYNRNQKSEQEQLFKHRKPEKSNVNQKQEMIQMGHDIQKDGTEALGRIQKNVYQMDKMADDINIELDRQIQQLDSIYDDMKDTNTTLKRAQKHIRYFARQVYTDKLMICLIVFIVIAIIVIIVLKIIGKTPNITIDEIK